MRTFDVDIDDDDAFERWFAPITATDAVLWPTLPGWHLAEIRAWARSRRDATQVLSCVADDDGAVAGASLISLPLCDNRDVANLNLLAVDPARRRRGLGSALWAYVQGVARAAGRSRVFVPVEVPLIAEDPAPESFCAALGFELAFASSKRRISVPAPEALLAQLERAAAPHAAADYDIVRWTDACPQRWLDARIALARAMSTDTPHAEIVEPSAVDERRHRDFEAMTDQMQRTTYVAGAVHRTSGDLVAFSDIAVSRIDPVLGYQWDTIVLGAHRGHRLGILVKIANLCAVAEASAGTRWLETWNADDNGPMIAVNEALGFERVARGGIWQRGLG